MLYRVESPDLRLIGTANGGTGRSPNIDDGNLNYDTGLVSSAAKFVTELSLSRSTYGIFVRASGLYDYEAEDQPTRRTPMSDDSQDSPGPTCACSTPSPTAASTSAGASSTCAPAAWS
jgi:hypothetical protein